MTKITLPPTKSSKERMSRRTAEIDAIVQRLAKGMTNKRGEPITTGVRFMTLFTERIFPSAATEMNFSNKVVSQQLIALLKEFMVNAKDTSEWNPADLENILTDNPRKPSTKRAGKKTPGS